MKHIFYHRFIFKSKPLSYILMKKQLEQISEDVLYTIADDTVNQIIGLNPASRPSRIGLYNANPEHLTKIMLRIYGGLKAKKIKGIEIFFGSNYGNYLVNVGELASKYGSILEINR
jgi:hypothetical protein